MMLWVIHRAMLGEVKLATNPQQGSRTASPRRSVVDIWTANEDFPFQQLVGSENSKMMIRIASVALVLALSACGGSGDNPVTGGQGGSTGPADPVIPGVTPDGDIPGDIGNNVQSVTFNPTSGTLSVQLTSLDDGSETATYTRNAALDVAGYQAYTQQDDPLDRLFIALGGQSPDGAVKAVAITDGGQFNRFFGGANYQRVGPYSQPTTGLVSYAGTYVGMTNIPAPGANLLPLGPGDDPAVAPREPERISGDIFLNVDFTDNAINGQIFNRRYVGTGVGIVDISLIETPIAADGTFAGQAELPDLSNAGTYAGTFGGTAASGVAGGVHLTELDDTIDGEEEFGAFALGRCGTPGASPLCP